MAPSFFGKYWELLIVKHKVKKDTLELGYKVWSEKYGTSEKNRRDFIWAVFQEVLRLQKSVSLNLMEMYERQREVYWDMQDFLNMEGEKTTQIQRALRNIELDIAEINDYVLKANIIGVPDCPNSAEIDGLEMTIEEARKKKLLPNPSCTRRTGCICEYGFRVLIDSNSEPHMNPKAKRKLKTLN